jgi:hypothetical protein
VFSSAAASFTMIFRLAVLSSVAQANEFVPACMAEQCADEAMALGSDAYVKDVTTCVATNFGPCATEAWECLGDAKCQQALQCAPKVFNTCSGDIWAMMTQPDEREKLMCLLNCEKDGKIDPLCALTKCGKAAADCLLDSTCLEAATCIPKAMLECSGEAFACVFGTDKKCQDNLKCLGAGVAACAAPTVNVLTDEKIADFVSCAGSKCPHPHVPGSQVASAPGAEVTASVGNPTNTAEQLLCMAAKCTDKTLKILADQDTKDLLKCVTQGDLPDLCPAAWDCLGDDACKQTLSCWAKPFSTCSKDMWSVLTDKTERKRIDDAVACIKSCESQHKDDFVLATFCVADQCGEGVLSCSKDEVCKSAVQCVPETVGECALPQLQAYHEQELFKNATNCLGRAGEFCGAAAVEMLRNQDVAEAVKCASMCTITPTSALV